MLDVLVYYYLLDVQKTLKGTFPQAWDNAQQTRNDERIQLTGFCLYVPGASSYNSFTKETEFWAECRLSLQYHQQIAAMSPQYRQQVASRSPANRNSIAAISSTYRHNMAM